MDTRPAKQARHHVLSERRAWEILSVVSRPLRGRIRLVSTGQEHRDLEVIHTYDWLEITVPSPEDHPRPRVINACKWVEEAGRIGALWHLLSCCPGFRAHENGPFWKRLVDSLEDSRVTANRRLSVPSDGLRFFELHGWKSVFPRFLLKPPIFDELEREEDAELMLDVGDVGDERVDNTAEWLDLVVRSFVGIGRPPPKSLDELAFYASELQAYTDLGWYWKNDVEIGVRLEQDYPLYGLADVVTNLVGSMVTRNQKDVANHNCVFLPRHLSRTRFTSLILDSPHPSEDLAELSEMVRACPIDIAAFNVDGHVPATELAAFLNHANRHSAGTLSRLSLCIDHATMDHVQVMFSILPVLSVRALRLTSSINNATPSMSVSRWTWLGYALFHPWSTWNELDLENWDIFQSTGVPMQSVFHVQVALYRMTHSSDDHTLTEATSGQYAFVRLRAKTKCFVSDDLTGRVLKVLDIEMEETAVIEASVKTVDGLPEAVCVIVRGIGASWVARQNVTDLWRLPARRSNVSRLRLGSRREPAAIELPLLLQDLRAVEFLDIVKCGPIDTLHLLPVLRATPHLKALCMESSCSVLAEVTGIDDDHALAKLRLRSLRLVDAYRGLNGTHAPSPAAWNTCLRNLREFVWDFECPSFDARESVVLAVVAQALTVEYMVWNNTWRGRDAPLSGYAGWRTASRSLFHRFRYDESIARLSFRYDARIAFLSIVKRVHTQRRDSAIGRVGQDIARKIFAFATTDVERLIWIDSY